MNTSSNINLKVPFSEKDQAKALGARWNAELKLWYVPQGVDAAPFEKWLVAGAVAGEEQSAGTKVVSAQTKSSADKERTATSTAPDMADDDMDAINARLRDAFESREFD